MYRCANELTPWFYQTTNIGGTPETRMKHALLALALLPMSSLAPAVAQDAVAAEPEERRTDRARTSFQEGVAYVEAGDLSAAEASFRQALAAHDAPSIRYNLASVLLEQGELPEAQQHIEAVLAGSRTPPTIRGHTRALRRQLAERAGYARFEVEGADGATIAIDGYELADPRAEVPLAPGRHIATASRGGVRIAETAFEVAAGDHHDVALVAEGADLEPSLEPGESSRQAAPLVEQWWLWAIVAGGAALVAIAIGVGAAVASESGVQAPLAGDFSPGVLSW